MRRPRGFTFVTFLLLLGLAAGILWVMTYGQAYIDDYDVKQILGQASNLAYQEPNDRKVHEFIYRQLHQKFDVDVVENGRTEKVLLFDAPEQNLRIERSKVPALIDIWFTYSRDVRVPLFNQIRTVTFYHHAQQDLSPVKW